MWNFIDSIPQASLDFWYRWLTIFAIGLPILGAIMGGVCGWGAFIVSNRIGNLQTADLRQAEQTISRQNVEVQTLKSRGLSAEEAAKMIAAARQLCPRIKKILVTAANGNQEAQAYALSFVKIFKDAGCMSDLALPIPGLTPDVQGVRVGVRSVTNIPEEVPMIEQILFAGGIKYQVNPITPDFFPDEPFVLIIGAKPT